ncbi:hypothetical protein PGT21_037273 [Puccinia graminis f. sp. tritici]|uniref:Uncharacterized protein n=1 Tax=Puccinia graminis f. sp. tritici TaxID=56615 RepID=A0A5B0R5G6_PUCGR|nr:hypothetical protein PGT21_037273 [Puccinia graminis f. sp. tritici]
MSSERPLWMRNRKLGNLIIPPLFPSENNDNQIYQQSPPQKQIYQQPRPEETIYQQPTNEQEPVIIESPGLYYDGNNFMRFLTRFEQAAKACKATDYDKALQIGQFMKMEELLTQLEAMDGYDTYNWATLRKEMIESWGEFDDITSYTTTYLVNLVEEFSREDEILSYQEFQTYLQNFSEILNEVVRNKDFKKKRDGSLLFISAFPQRIQNNIRQTLIKNGQLPTGLDGISLPPLWKYVTEVAEMQIRLENDRLQRILNRKAPNYHPQAEKSIEDLVKEVASLKKQIMELRPPVIYKHSPPVAPLEPVVDFTEPEIDVFEPATDIMGPGTYYEEPKMGITETTLKEATTTVLPDLVAEWKAASVNVMDTAMELLHTVIDIPEMEVDKLDIVQSTKTSEVLDQPVQPVVKTLDQSTRINKNYIQFLLTEKLPEDLEFPKAPKILWIQNINKHEPKLFNKQLFNPYLDSYQLFQDYNSTSVIPFSIQQKGFTTTFESYTGRVSFQSTRYLYLVDRKASTSPAARVSFQPAISPSGPGYPLGYPDTHQLFAEKGPSAPVGGYPPADNGYPRRIPFDHL